MHLPVNNLFSKVKSSFCLDGQVLTNLVITFEIFVRNGIVLFNITSSASAESTCSYISVKKRTFVTYIHSQRPNDALFVVYWLDVDNVSQLFILFAHYNVMRHLKIMSNNNAAKSNKVYAYLLI